MTWMILLQNIWVRRALMAAGVVLALLAVRQHYVNLGEHKGVQSAQATSAQDNEQTRSQERRDVLAEIGTLREQIATIDARGTVLVAAVSKNAAANESIQGERLAAANTVAQIPSGSLHAANANAMREQGIAVQSGVVYSDAEERTIAACLADRPLCQKQNEALSGENSGLQQQVEDASRTRALQQQQYDSLAGYAGELENSYVQLYNAVPKRRNWAVSILTMGIAGKPRKLSVPSVEDLRRGHGEAKAGR